MTARDHLEQTRKREGTHTLPHGLLDLGPADLGHQCPHQPRQVASFCVYGSCGEAALSKTQEGKDIIHPVGEYFLCFHHKAF